MNEEMNQLIALQKIDAELAGFDREINEQKQEIINRQQSIAEKEEAITASLEKAKNLELKKRQIEIDNQDAGERIKDRQNKMMQVQTSREHQALLKEIEDNKRLIKESEEQLIRMMEAIEQAEQEAEELKNLLTGEQESLSDETTLVDKRIKKIESRRKSVAAERDKLAATMNASRLKRYDMLLKKRDGLAVTRAVNGVCQGCFMTIPPQQFNEVRKGDTIHVCPTCQRMLYYEEESEDA